MGDWKQDEVSITGNNAITLDGDATVFDDVTVDILKTRLQGGNDPTFANYTGGLYAFSFADGNETFFSIQMPHRILALSTIHVHVHFGPSNTDGGNTKFGVEMDWADIDGTFGNAFTLTTSDSAVGTTALAHKYLNIDDITNATHGVNDNASCIGNGRFFRQAADASNYGSAVWVWSVDFHIEIDKLGSRTETAW